MRNMRNLWLLLIVLVTVPAFSQHNFTVQELIDIYHSEKETAIKSVESKGYSKAEYDIHRQMYGQVTGENQMAFSGKDDRIVIGLTFRDNRVTSVVYRGAINLVNELLEQLRKSDLEPVNDKRPVYEVYTKKKLDYFIWYEIVDLEKKDQAFISVLPKSKHMKILYNPKR